MPKIKYGRIVDDAIQTNMAEIESQKSNMAELKKQDGGICLRKMAELEFVRVYLIWD